MGISYFKFSFFILQVPAITIQCPVLWGRKAWYTIMAFNALLVLTSITRTLILPYCLVFDWVRSRWSTMVVSVFTKSLTSYVRRAICIDYPDFLLHKASEASTSNPLFASCECFCTNTSGAAVCICMLWLVEWNNVVEVLLLLSVPKQFTPLKLFTATADVL
jgi:hypothetical protein